MRVEALDLLYYRTGYKYQTLERIRYRLPEEFRAYTIKLAFLELADCIMTVQPGYAGDGPSGPTADSKCGMRAAFLHDPLYQLVREGHLPRELKDLIDDLFHEQLLTDGMGKFRAWLWHRGVKKCGMGATIHNKNILVAP